MRLLPLDNDQQLIELDEESKVGPGIVIFKHSNRCVISSMAWDRLQREWDEQVADLVVYKVDVVANRSLSQEIASRYGVQHESPQILLVKDGKVIYHQSHNGIRVEELKEQLVNA